MLIGKERFSEIIKVGKMLEEGMKNGSIIILEALQGTNKAFQSGRIYDNKKKKDVGSNMVA